MAAPAKNASAYALLVAATLFWAGNYVLGKFAVQVIPPVSLVFLRWLLAALPLVAIASYVEKPDWKEVFKRWPLLALLAALGLGGYTSLLYFALFHTSPLNASLINSFNPALIMLASALFLGEGLGARRIAGVILGFLGVLLVLTKGSLGALASFAFNAGDLLMLGAIACWTAYTILGRRLKPLKPITATAAQSVLVVLLMAPLLPFTGLVLPATPQALASLAYIAVFPSVLSYLCWNLALSRLDPGKAGVYLNLIVLFTAIATVLLGTPLGAAQVAGGILVLGGVLLSSWKGKAGK